MRSEPLSAVRPRGWWLPYAAHVPLVLWLFAGPLLQGRVLYFRDLSLQYYPDYVFLERWLRQGVWPTWNPMVDAGTPFLLAYPLDLLLLVVGGARATLAAGPALHVLLALCGGTRLARVLGAGACGAWAAGAVLGLSGCVLSSVNLLQILQAAAWAPWVIAAFLRCVREPSARRAATLAVCSALQLSTAAGEIALQTALAGLVLSPPVRRRPQLAAVAAAAMLTVALSAPALLGIRALLEGGRRAAGFSASEALAWSASPIVLAESVLPRLFGDVHTFSNVGYWGQRFFAGGYPYLLSLYVGLPVLLMALQAGRSPVARRLWVLAAVSALLAMGSYGPFAFVLTGGLSVFRTPVKFVFGATLALALLAGLGLDRVLGGQRRASWAQALGPLLLLLLGIIVLRSPDRFTAWAGTVVPEMLEATAQVVAATAWPFAFLMAGTLSAGVWVCLRAGRRVAPLAAVLAAADLLIVNGDLNLSTQPSFYALRPAIASMVRAAAASGPDRWFSYGVSNSPGLTWSPAIARLNSDVWLYYADRQALWARTPVLDGLETALGEDRAGWAPPHATIELREATPGLYPRLHQRLRRANVRWVLSFHDLAGPRAVLRAQVQMPEIAQPLRLYEVGDALPRAFWVPRAEFVPDAAALQARLARPEFDPRQVVLIEGAGADVPPPASTSAPGAGAVAFERLDPHTVRLRCSGPPGYVVVLEGYHRDWRVQGPSGSVPLRKAYERYWAFPAPGGDQAYVVRYAPSWPAPALVCSMLGVIGAFWMVLAGGNSTAAERPRPQAHPPSA